MVDYWVLKPFDTGTQGIEAQGIEAQGIEAQGIGAFGIVALGIGLDWVVIGSVEDQCIRCPPSGRSHHSCCRRLD